MSRPRSQAQLEAQLRGRGLFFGDRPLCTVLRPRFMTPGAAPLAPAPACAVIARAFAQGPPGGAGRPARAGPVRPRAAGRSGSSPPIPASPSRARPRRLDAFFARRRRRLRFTEYNAETPAGGGLQRRALDRVLRAAGHAASSSAASTCGRCRRATACCTCCSTPTSSGAAARAPPAVAILDWSDVPDPQRVRALPGLLPRAGRGVHHRRPARGGVSRRPAPGRRVRRSR